MRRLKKFRWLLVLTCLSRVNAAEQATVMSDVEPVYSKASSSAPVIVVLKKGDAVTIVFSSATPGGDWCAISMPAAPGKIGNVPCESLNRTTVPQRSARLLTDAEARAPQTTPQRAGRKPAPQTGDFVVTFSGPFPAGATRDRQIDYDLVPNRERFFVHVPPDYTGAEAFGLVVFTDADEKTLAVPRGWKEVLDRKKLLFISAQASGNEQDENRRLGLAVLAATEMRNLYSVNPTRVYAAGFSGGARISNLLGFFQSDIFSGTIQSCGADFYEPVPQRQATSTLDTAGFPYGLAAAPATSDEIQRAKRKVRFALITGSQDFRRGNILDIYNGGYAPQGFQARLYDVAGMGHDTADGRTFAQALAFLEGP